MHLELLKDLELMDFEGIYNVSSHPNTLYIVYSIWEPDVSIKPKEKDRNFALLLMTVFLYSESQQGRP